MNDANLCFGRYFAAHFQIDSADKNQSGNSGLFDVRAGLEPEQLPLLPDILSMC